MCAWLTHSTTTVLQRKFAMFVKLMLSFPQKIFVYVKQDVKRIIMRKLK